MSKTERGPWSDRLDDETRGIVEGLEAARLGFRMGDPIRDSITDAIDRLKRPEGWPKGAPLPEFVPQKGERARHKGSGFVYVIDSGLPERNSLYEWAVRTTVGDFPDVNLLTPAPTTRTVTLKATDAMVEAAKVAWGNPQVEYGFSHWMRAAINAALAAAPITVDPTLTDDQITARFAGMDVEVGR